MEELVLAIQSNNADIVGKSAEKHKRILNSIINLPLHNEYYEVIPGRSAVHDATQHTPLIYAMIRGTSDNVLETLLKKGADPNVADRYTNPLILAVNYQSESYCKILLEHGANPNSEHYIHNWENPYVASPLLNAIMRKNHKLVKILLGHGAVPSAGILETILEQIRKQDVEENPEHILEVFKTAEPIFHHGFNINSIDSEGETILHKIAKMYMYPSSIRASLVRYLKKHGANPDIQNKDGKYAVEVLQEPFDELPDQTQILRKLLVAPLKKNMYRVLALGTSNIFPNKFYPALTERVSGNIILQAEQSPESPNKTNRMPNIPSFSLFEYNTSNKSKKNRTSKNKTKATKSRKTPRKTPYQQLHANQPNKPTGYLPRNMAKYITEFAY